MITYGKLQLEISFDELRHGVKVNVTVQLNSGSTYVQIQAQGLTEISSDDNLSQWPWLEVRLNPISANATK